MALMDIYAHLSALYPFFAASREESLKRNSIDILVLKACYRIYQLNDATFQNMNSYGDWEMAVSKVIGYDLPELVSISDSRLIELGLLSGRSYGDKSGVRPGREFRLTKLSLKLCEYISNWP